MTGSDLSESLPCLDEDEKVFLTEMFQEKICPKLVRLGARLGTINCGFAGEKYGKWNIIFKSIGSDFMISEFEYDEEGTDMDLDL